MYEGLEFDLDMIQVSVVRMLQVLLKTAHRKTLEAEKMLIFWFSVLIGIPFEG